MSRQAMSRPSQSFTRRRGHTKKGHYSADPTTGKAQMVCTAGRGKQTTVTGLSEPANCFYHSTLAPYTAEQMVKWLNHVCLEKD